MKQNLLLSKDAPQFTVTCNVTFAQTDYWFGHTTKDLKMNIIFPEDDTRTYPCIVWICGGAWLTLDRDAHLAYLSDLARTGFVVASVDYRTSNEAIWPAQIEDVKAAIRYLRAHAGRYHIDVFHIGTMGESAGGYLTAMSALIGDDNKTFDKGAYLEYSSAVQAAVPWYPPCDLTKFPIITDAESISAPESLLFGKNIYECKNDATGLDVTGYVTKSAPPFLIIHGTDDHTVPHEQGVLLHDALEEAGCDVTLLSLEGADHADIRFFQQELWDKITAFFHKHLDC